MVHDSTEATQLPAADEIFLDHVGYFAADLSIAGATLERLGFQVSQINVQTNDDGSGRLVPSGTSNRLARLRLGYLEILAPTHDTPLGAQARAALARYTGLHLIALSHDDIPAQRARLIDAGFVMQEVVHLRRRDVTLPGAPEVAWSVLRPQPGVMVEGRIQFTKSHNPEHVWRDELTLHANAADALGDVLICVTDRPEAAARYSRYTGREAVEAEDMTTVALDRGRLVFAEPAVAQRVVPQFHAPSLPFIAGIAIRSSDMARTRAALNAAAVNPLCADEKMICIDPRDALGATMLFHAHDVIDPWKAQSQRSR
jgi:hypothetical protein